MPALTLFMQAGLVVKSLVQGSTAQQDGQVEVGDEIMAVDGLSVSHDSLAHLAQKILGEAGSTVCICARACVRARVRVSVCARVGERGKSRFFCVL